MISGSIDNSVIVWNWQETETPSLVLKGHMGAITSLALGGDDSKLFSDAQDGTMKMWNMITGDLINEIVYGAHVDCVAKCSASEMVAVGTGDAYLRCRDWISGESLFEYRMADNGSISAVQFGADGKVLVCGNTLGSATAWYTSDWKKAATVYVPGLITGISFLPNGTNVILGSSEGEIRHCKIADEDLTRYNVCMARPANGLSFRKNGKEIIAGVNLGYARAWTGPQTNPNLDFAAVRNNMLFDFALSDNGARVGTATHDGIIRLWSTVTGTRIAEYVATVDGSSRLALSADGAKLASSSSKGAIFTWNPEMAPNDADISIRLNADNVSCLGFSPDAREFLVCLENEAENP